MILTGTFEGPEAIANSWEYIIRTIMTQGEENHTEYGLKSKFVNGLAIELKNPGEMNWHPMDPICSKNFVEEYKKQFIRGYTARRVAEVGDIGAFQYTYMDRLTEYPGVKAEARGIHYFLKGVIDTLLCKRRMETGRMPVDQIEFIRSQLKAKRYESRRIEAITWVPDIDEDKDNKDPPCLQRIWVYLRPGDIIDVHVNFRSWDMFKGYPANLNAILWMIRVEFLEPCGLRLGAIRFMSDNCHVYADDWDAARKAFHLVAAA